MALAAPEPDGIEQAPRDLEAAMDHAINTDPQGGRDTMSNTTQDEGRDTVSDTIYTRASTTSLTDQVVGYQSMTCSKHGVTISVLDKRVQIRCGDCYAEAMAALTEAYRVENGIEWKQKDENTMSDKTIKTPTVTWETPDEIVTYLRADRSTGAITLPGMDGWSTVVSHARLLEAADEIERLRAGLASAKADGAQQALATLGTCGCCGMEHDYTVCS
jgi:hypothetical protein